MTTINTQNRAELEALLAVEERRRLVLAQLETTAQSAAMTLNLFAELQAAISPEGEIGSVWTDADEDHAAYIQKLGEAIPAVVSALQGIIGAAWLLRQAGAGIGLNILTGLPALPSLED